MTRWFGIDPGSKGAIACIDENNEVIFIEDLDSSRATYERFIMRHMGHALLHQNVAVEEVYGRPGQSCKANNTFMKLAGMAELMGWMITTDSFITVLPSVWKKHFGLIFPKTLSKTEKKHKSVELARELFPPVADTLLMSKDGRAEALLIARWLKDVQSESKLSRDLLQTAESN